MMFILCTGRNAFYMRIIWGSSKKKMAEALYRNRSNERVQRRAVGRSIHSAMNRTSPVHAELILGVPIIVPDAIGTVVNHPLICVMRRGVLQHG